VVVKPLNLEKNPSTGADMVAVNIRCLEDIDLSAIEIKQIDGKSF
jgi:hypothetical protein